MNDEKEKNVKKNSKIIVIIFVIIVMVSSVITFIYLKGRQTNKPQTLTIVKDGKNTLVDFSTLSLENFSGSITNGKGETRKINGKGVKLEEFTGNSGFSEAKIVADDEYFAIVKCDEIENAWIQIESQKARLIVFGDSNSKRDVKNVVRIEIN